MNPYSVLDSDTLGMVAQSGVNPADVQPSQNSAYPTYPNAAGVGSQTAGVAPQPSAAPAPQKLEVPDSTSRGMSPYSLLGDANYRQRQE
jgi:hypothetical protein